jgi:exosortase
MSEAANTRRSPATSRWWIAAGVLALVCYRDFLRFQPERAFSDEIEEWFFIPTETLAPLVLGMSLWLLYRRVGRRRALPARAGGLAVGGVLLLAGLFAALWAAHTDARDLLVPSLMLNACAVAWLWRGGPGVRTVALPVAFLAFAVPIPAPLLNELLFWLQIGTTEISGFFLYWLSIPHFVAGEQILRTSGTFSVIESCSGLRSIEILTMVAILMADLFRRRGLHAVLVVLAAPPVAFLLNGIRALLLILNPHSEIATVHNLQGVAILLGGVVLLFLWDGLLERIPFPSRHSDASRASTHSGISRGGSGAAGPHRLAAPLVVATLAAVLVTPFLLQAAGPPDYVRGVGEQVVAGLGPSRELDVDQEFLGSVGFRGTVARRVRMEQGEVSVFIGVGNRYDRARSPLSPKTGFPGSGWVTEHESLQQLEPDGPVAKVRVMRSGSQRWLVYHWYESADSLPVESFRALLGLDRSRLRSRQEILAVRVEVPLAGPLKRAEPAGRKVFLRFYDQLRPLLSELTAALAGKTFS